MARGGSIGQKRKTKNKVQLQTKGSDESDEDYKVDEEEFNESEDDCSFAEDESDDSLWLDDEEEDEWLEKKVKEIECPKRKQGFQTRKKNCGVKRRRKRVVCSTEEEGDDDDDDDYSYGVKRRKKNMVSYKEEENDEFDILHKEEDDDFDEKMRKQTRASRKENIEDQVYRDKISLSHEEKEDDDYDDSYEDDEEFSPGEVLKGTTRNLVKKRVFRRKNRSNGIKEFIGDALTNQKNKTDKICGWGRKKRRRKSKLNSDSDFVSSGSSDFEFTVSEEEREQMRESSEFCRRLTTKPRSLRSSKNVKKEEKLPSKGKHLGKKGKQKEVETKIEAGKLVCGICLSEEGKRTVKGVLNCCSHYFCFACIMEWSKVESRCPLCKQRFSTISRTAKGEGGRDVRGAVFPVPERDQVYQPSEEELRGYLDPYENVLCTECLQGGDDALMLLCDLCDSPAHTYCVGLGREVPDGNWYCDGCRPTTLASSNAQSLNPVTDRGGTNNFSMGSPPASSVRETFDLNEAYVPDTPMSQEYVQHQSPRHFAGHFQTNSPPISGSGAFTLFERRRIQRQINQFLNNRQRQLDRNDERVAPGPAFNLFGSSIMEATTAPQNMYVQGRLPDYNTPSSVFSPRLSRFGEPLYNQASTSADPAFAGSFLRDISGINARIGNGLGHSPLHPCSGASNTGTATSSTSPYQFRGATVPSRTLQLHR